MTTSATSSLFDANAYDIAAEVLGRPESQRLVSVALEELLLALPAAGFEPSGTFPVLVGEAYRGCIQVAAVMAYDPARRASVEVRSVLYVHTVSASRSQAQLYYEAVIHDSARATSGVSVGRRLAQVDLHELPPALAAERANWFGVDFMRAVQGVLRTLERDAADLFFKDNAEGLVLALDKALAH